MPWYHTMYCFFEEVASLNDESDLYSQLTHSQRLELIWGHWRDLQLCQVRDVCYYSLFALKLDNLFTCLLSSITEIKNNLLSITRLTTLLHERCKLQSQFALVPENLLSLWKGCKLTWWEWLVSSAGSMRFRLMRVTCLISFILRIELISHHWPDL